MGLHDPVNTDDDISVFNVSKKKRAVVKKKNKDVGRAINLGM